MKKALIIGGTVYANNRGVAAITVGAIQALKKALDDENITLIHNFVQSSYPRCTASCKLGNINVIVDDKDSNRLTMVRHLLKMVARILLICLGRIAQALGFDHDMFANDKVLRSYAQATIVVNLSYGDRFAFIKSEALYSLILFASLAAHCLLAILLRKPLIFLPQSIGPFECSIVKPIARFVLNRADVVMARESITREYLRELGVRKNVSVHGDLAFFLEPVPKERVEEILLEEDANHIIKDETYLFGISLRNIFRRASEYRLEVIAEAVEHVLGLEEKSAVILVPHDSSSNTNYDPRLLAEKLILTLGKRSRVVSIRGEYTAEELKGIIIRCSLFIGAFMHSNIAAVSTQIPTIAIAYSHKTQGIMDMVKLDEYVWDARYMNLEQLIEKIDLAWDNRKSIRSILESNVNLLQDSTSIAIDALLERFLGASYY